MNSYMYSTQYDTWHIKSQSMLVIIIVVVIIALLVFFQGNWVHLGLGFNPLDFSEIHFTSMI